ncbi:DUF2799 domain-containing protein [Sinimarinibacterium sp. NLF-5-8]|uniref:DUF2799 domain-containing protein n=1 Tax=Sinimarinibacterium sp. NLF-5-8 TaxID=2698684 RepID=UPI00137BD2C1|nr:DUF2799 domain-containing protein [Sinimarinibacterium sp. NLF-5-8]QHS10846.1 DUF2799 domain-containing protein [Sinimarinibacterium sp. NLF-5-8]
MIESWPRPRILAVRALFLGAVLAAGGCATLDESSCRSGDWQQIGYADGVNGQSASRLADHGKACARYGIAADQTGWQLGYAQGLGRYCTAENGYVQGRDGRSYGNVCPAALDAQFRPAYDAGRRTHGLRQQLQSLDQQLDQVLATLGEDDRRARDYLDAARRGREVAAPELLSRRDRKTLEREQTQLQQDYNKTRHALDQTDQTAAARYGAPPLQPIVRGY